MQFKDTTYTQTLAPAQNSTKKNETIAIVQQFNRFVENFCKKIANENKARQKEREREREREKGGGVERESFSFLTY